MAKVTLMDYDKAARVVVKIGNTTVKNGKAKPIEVVEK